MEIIVESERKETGREMEDSLTMVMCSSVAGAKEGARGNHSLGAVMRGTE